MEVIRWSPVWDTASISFKIMDLYVMHVSKIASSSYMCLLIAMFLLSFLKMIMKTIGLNKFSALIINNQSESLVKVKVV